MKKEEVRKGWENGNDGKVGKGGEGRERWDPDSTAKDSKAELYLPTTLRHYFFQNADSMAELTKCRLRFDKINNS